MYGVQLNAFLNWALDEAQWPVSWPGCFTNEDLQYPLKKRPGGLQSWSASLGKRGQVGSRAGLQVWESKHDFSVTQPQVL